MSGFIAAAAVTAVAAKQAGDKADRRNRRNLATAAAADDKQLAFDRERFDESNKRYNRDYKRYIEIYGDVESNLGDFYGRLTPDVLAGTQLTEQASEYSRATEQIKTSIAQRNIEGAGFAESELNKAALQNAEANATIRADAPLKTAALKSSFVQGRSAPGTAALDNASARVSSTMGNNASARFSRTQADNNRRANADAQTISSVGNIIGAGLNAYASGAFDTPPPTPPTPPEGTV